MEDPSILGPYCVPLILAELPGVQAEVKACSSMRQEKTGIVRSVRRGNLPFILHHNLCCPERHRSEKVRVANNTCVSQNPSLPCVQLAALSESCHSLLPRKTPSSRPRFSLSTVRIAGYCWRPGSWRTCYHTNIPANAR